MIERMKKEHARQVAQLHIKGISTGFISSLGFSFVVPLYESVCDSPHGFGYVDIENGKVAGFVAFTTDLSKLYKYIFLKKGILFFSVMFKKLFSCKTLKKMFQTLLYPQKTGVLNLPKAELLAIAVDDSMRGKGIAPALIQNGLEECKCKGISQVKVLVAEFNKAANKLYQKAGFSYVTQVDSHGIKSNIYKIELSKSDDIC